MFDFILAVALSKLLVDSKPAYVIELYQQAMTHAFAGEYAQAEQYLTEAIRLEPQSEALWTYRSIARGMLGNVAGAAADWEEAQKWNKEAIQETIEAAYFAKEWSKVMQYTEWYANQKSLAPSGCYYHGCALIGLGREDEALPFIKRALEHEEDLRGLCGWAHSVCAQLLLMEETKYVTNRSKELLKETIDHCDKAWNFGYRTTTLLHYRAYANWKLENKEEAVLDMRKATMLDSRSVKLRLHLVEYLEGAGRWQDAQEELTWLKRLITSNQDKEQYGTIIKDHESKVSGKLVKEKTNESLSPKSLEQQWSSKWPR
jgi:tetratricopeptide (TPR) repeat protein